ncbi:MAG: efflux RND transporter periplasmic adaptor subunit [Flavobacteriaceae bacterium]|nr:efflux RND transporter periplasmic adaptor subunit [Flavobacteriaceae bacterium]
MNVKKILLITGILVLALLGIWAFMYNQNKSSQDIVKFETTQLFKTDIKKTSVATGDVKPRESIEIKPNISGVISKLAVEEGALVESGQLLATIRVVPNVNSLNAARQMINSAEISVQNETRHYNRQKSLFDQGVISRAEYESALASFNIAKQNLRNAQNDYKVAQSGIAPGLERYATTQIRSTIKGMVLDIPVEIGDNVQEINNFSTGTTIATVANIDDMIFEGKVDEADVGKLKEGMPIEITIGALPGQVFTGKLYFISPSGVEENGVVQFEIKATVDLKEDTFVRAGYSANAEIVTENKSNIWALKESEIQYDDKNNPFVEVKNGDNWEKRNVRLGTSDGINVEILAGVKEGDLIKIYNTDLKTDQNMHQRRD